MRKKTLLFVVYCVVNSEELFAMDIGNMNEFKERDIKVAMTPMTITGLLENICTGSHLYLCLSTLLEKVAQI